MTTESNRLIEERYSALTAELERLPMLRAPAGWRERFLASLDEEETPGIVPIRRATPSARPRRWPLVAAPLALAAAIIVYLVWPDPEPRGDQIAVEVRRGDTLRRNGETPAVGDTFVARVRIAGAGELRVYRDATTLLARCPGHPACQSRLDGDHREVSIALPMATAGHYRAAAILGRDDVPLTGSLDGDLGAARARGAGVIAGPTVPAR